MLNACNYGPFKSKFSLMPGIVHNATLMNVGRHGAARVTLFDAGKGVVLELGCREGGG